LIVAALAAWLPTGPVSLPDIFLGALAYGATVLTFMGGVRLGAGTGSDPWGSAVAVLAALAGWIALLIPPLLGLCLLIAGFFLQSFSNVLASEQGTLPRWFGKFSSLLTAGAVLALLALLVRLLT
jgi:hypothetical protein